MAKAVSLGLLIAKSQGWGVYILINLPAGEIWNCIQYSSWIHTNSVKSLTAKMPTLKDSVWSQGHSLCCTGISYHIWVYDSRSQWRQHTRWHFGNLWELLLREVVKVTETHCCWLVDGTQRWLRMLGLALYNKELSCTTFQCSTRHSCNWEDCL